MLKVHCVMDGPNYQQNHQTDTAMYGLPNIPAQFCPRGTENQLLHTNFDLWNHFVYPPSTFPSTASLNDTRQLLNSPSEAYSDALSINGQNYEEPSLEPINLSMFQCRNGEQMQDLNYIDDNSLFSSPESLPDIADTDDLLPLYFPTQSFSNHLQISNGPTHSFQTSIQLEEEEESDDEEPEELGHAETYADYVPSKSKIGINHPDRVVETSTLSSVPPPNIRYTLCLPPLTISNGSLSALQLEAIIYACQQHEVLLENNHRAGFLIGDGAGVGKGRTVAGIIYENYIRGRKKSLWFSVSNDLKYDAERDLRDIAANIPVHALNKIKYGDTATSEGVLFATYSALIGESQAGGQHRTRLKQILDWCGEHFDGVIVFDECHKAKNVCVNGSTKSTKTGLAVLELQNRLPYARVVYASATGASEPKNMAYMCRLGIWGEGTPFRQFEDFLRAIEKRGVGAMEIVAMDMKVSGMYIARQLSFAGVTFRIEEIPLDESFKLVYNKAAVLWAEAMNIFQHAAELIGLESRKSLWGQFWSAHQRFFKYLCIAAKVRRLVEIGRHEQQKGKCVVIGLQSTGEARTREVLDENDGHLNQFVSAAEGVFKSLIQKHFPSTKRKKEKGAGTKRKRKQRGRPSKQVRSVQDCVYLLKSSDDSSCDSDLDTDSDLNSSPASAIEISEEADVIAVDPPINGFLSTEKAATLEFVEKMKGDLLAKVELLGKELPLNTLDELIDLFGGPEHVAEMTGRKGRVVRKPDGSVCYESRAEQNLSIDHVNLKEKERFMDGDKLVAIISEAASSGISLQADKRIKNQRRRVHMTLELPWSADRAIQQFGRTHRSNQVSAPEYIFLISELAGERRFASIVAKRLESLGALTHGDRRATESRDLSKYNFDNKYGTRALDKVIKTILGQVENKVQPPKDYVGGPTAFIEDMRMGLMAVGIFCKENRYGYVNVEKDCSISKFLNRILGLEVHKQNALFQYFTDTFDYLIEKDKKEGKYDMGILDLAPGVEEIYEERQEVFLTPGHPQDGQVVLYKISVDRGMPWEEAYQKSLTLTGDNDGFYISHRLRGNEPFALLAEQINVKNYVLYKPNIGKQIQPESFDNLRKKYKRVKPEEAKEFWENLYNFAFQKCSHAAWNGKCKIVQQGKECFQGMRLRHYYMLCGALLRVWNKVGNIMSDVTNSSHLQIVRLKTKEQKKQVGIKIPEACVYNVIEELKKMDFAVKKKQEENRLANQVLHMCQSEPADSLPVAQSFNSNAQILSDTFDPVRVLQELLGYDYDQYGEQEQMPSQDRQSVIQYGQPSHIWEAG
ncbi:protein strawberry notch homolog 2-like [Pristis pectinata]|uniref:protein strawberry notch homolog 2-like n=1 Tax=Pristis pectinata TaxID=685728 RepID=UPI00223DABDE|nr:protein strawberry notch homolog 2-like [Pristis pectinata]